jgi:8-oxo-dGTP pyrophosphatase MutT (NUDIX family)
MQNKTMFKAIRNFLFQTYFKITRSMTLGVRIAAFDSSGKICLVKHTYIDGWHLPGGGVERGENAYIAAQKELSEEAGIFTNINDLTLISIHTNFRNFSGDHVILFKVTNFTTKISNRPHEIKECEFFALDNLPKDTTRATCERIAEIMGQQEAKTEW